MAEFKVKFRPQIQKWVSALYLYNYATPSNGYCFWTNVMMMVNGENVLFRTYKHSQMQIYHKIIKNVHNSPWISIDSNV